jgi:aspartyl-tRNA(Asn)/glutamyl-tRNA(Gln) amidotransferase subunit A
VAGGAKRYGDWRGIDALASALGSGETSARALVTDALGRAEASAELGIFTVLRPQAALAEADLSDARRRAGNPRSLLDGIPYAVKDNIAQSGELLGCGSRFLENYRSPFSATCIEKLRAAGAISIGTTNMDEFAMGSSTEHSVHGPTRNPWDPTRAPGGSSGGSAAAVAAGVVPFSLGSDTGGSIRQPAAFCGVVGMKPTYGRVSRWGLVAFASSLDQIGPFAQSAADCARVLDEIAGSDPRDSTSLPEEAPSCSGVLGAGVEGLRIGVPREFFEMDGASPEVNASVREALRQLEDRGATLCDVSLPHTAHAIAAYYLVATAEASSNLARFDGARYGRRSESAKSLSEMYELSRSEGFGAEVKRRILLGTYVLSAGYYDEYYRKAQQVRTLLRRDFDEAFATCDVIATPTAPEVAFRLGEKSDPLTMYLSDVFTVSASLVGAPGVSVPCGLVDGLPVGLQLLGRPGDDPMPLRVGASYQEASDFCALPPGFEAIPDAGSTR